MIATLPEDEQPQGPRLPEWVAPIWRAWHRLTHDRPWIPGGMGGSMPGRIPWRSVMDWAEHNGLGRDDADLLDGCIQRMDAVFEQWYAERQQLNAAGNKGRAA